uniref:Uncharacterized protein n=1 Tax=Arundo donax TaxID=35708 RepID=A0A0A8Y389_ARUDO
MLSNMFCFRVLYVLGNQFFLLLLKLRNADCLLNYFVTDLKQASHSLALYCY